MALKYKIQTGTRRQKMLLFLAVDVDGDYIKK
jgi:hypothetical protein